MIVPFDFRVSSLVSPSTWPSQKTGWPTEVARLWRSAGETALAPPEPVLRNASQRMSPIATAITMAAPVRNDVDLGSARDSVGAPVSSLETGSGGACPRAGVCSLTALE